MDSNFSKLHPDEQRRLLDKLAKLQAISNCATGNVNETATAAAAMARIMLEYEIEMADLDGAGPGQDLTVLHEQVDDSDSYRGYPVWQTLLLSCLAEVHHCIAYSSSAAEAVLFSVRYRQTRHLIGTAQDIENVRRLFQFSVAEIERLSKSWGKGRSQKHRNDFKTGASRGVRDQIRLERDRIMEEQRAKKLPSRALQLFDQKQQASLDFARTLGLGSKSVSGSRGVYADAYGAGYEAGSQMDLQESKPRPALTSGSLF